MVRSVSNLLQHKFTVSVRSVKFDFVEEIFLNFTFNSIHRRLDGGRVPENSLFFIFSAYILDRTVHSRRHPPPLEGIPADFWKGERRKKVDGEEVGPISAFSRVFIFRGFVQ